LESTKKIEIVLGPGQTQITDYIYQTNYVMKGFVVAGAIAGGAFKGTTVNCFIKHVGTPYNDSVTNTSVSSGQVNLDVIWTKTNQYRVINHEYYDYLRTNNIASSFAVAEEIMNDESGAKQVDAPA